MKTNVIKLDTKRRVTPEDRKREIFQEVANLMTELGWSAIGHDSPDPQFLLIGNYYMIQEIMARIRNPVNTQEEYYGPTDSDG